MKRLSIVRACTRLCVGHTTRGVKVGVGCGRSITTQSEDWGDANVARLKIKCCGYKPEDKYYLEAVVQELVYQPTTVSLDELEIMELQGIKWIEEWAKAQRKGR